jgi:hypothetical protein
MTLLLRVCVYPPIVARQRLGKNPTVARQRLGRNVTAVTNTHVTIEARVVSRKVGD